MDKLVADKPMFENKLDSAQYTLTNCRAFLDALPDDAVLEPVASVKPNGFDLDTVRRIEDAEDEVKRLRAVPVPTPISRSGSESMWPRWHDRRSAGSPTGNVASVLARRRDLGTGAAAARRDGECACAGDRTRRERADAADTTQEAYRELQAADRHAATASLGARRRHQRPAACGRAGGSGRVEELARGLMGPARVTAPVPRDRTTGAPPWDLWSALPHVSHMTINRGDSGMATRAALYREKAEMCLRGGACAAARESRAERHGHDLSPFANLRRWLQALLARPAVKRGLAVKMEAAFHVDMNDRRCARFCSTSGRGERCPLVWPCHFPRGLCDRNAKDMLCYVRISSSRAGGRWQINRTA